jgi:hypothetical protein
LEFALNDFTLPWCLFFLIASVVHVNSKITRDGTITIIMIIRYTCMFDKCSSAECRGQFTTELTCKKELQSNQDHEEY